MMEQLATLNAEAAALRCKIEEAARDVKKDKEAGDDAFSLEIYRNLNKDLTDNNARRARLEAALPAGARWHPPLITCRVYSAASSLPACLHLAVLSAVQPPSHVAAELSAAAEGTSGVGWL